MVDRGVLNFVAPDDPIRHSWWAPCEEDIAGVRGGDGSDTGSISRGCIQGREGQGGERGEEAKREGKDERQQQ